jgi:hypothetical protein
MDSFSCQVVYAAVTIPGVNKRNPLYVTDRENVLQVTLMDKVAVEHYSYLNGMTHNALDIMV